MGSVAVAFSGGVDSTYLLKVSFEVLSSKAAAVTGTSLSFPVRELKAAQNFCQKEGIKHFLVDSEELNLEGFSENPPNRCYLCKKELFAKIKRLGNKEGFKEVIEASNIDDEGDYRPGLLAISELNIKSPLRAAKLTKEEIRQLSRELNLPTWNKPSFACLASRFPYGETITAEKLKKIDKAEQYLLDLGFNQVRVRFHDHGQLARIETDNEGLILLTNPETRRLVNEEFSQLGFNYTSVDLKGYRTGSMNATLPPK
jgi:uncharacterized protein